MKNSVLTFLLLLIALTGCDQQKTEAPSAPLIGAAKPASPATPPAGNRPAKTFQTPAGPSVPTAAPPLLTQPQPAHFVEMPGDVLPLWRRYRDQQPTLVIISPDPMLMIVAPEVREEIATLVEHGKPEEFLNRGRTQVVDPLFLWRQTLTIALNSKFFSRIVWIAPPPKKDQEFIAETFRTRLHQSGILTPAEAAELTYADGLFHGSLQGLPFTVSATGPLPQLDGPVVMHIDFSFFSEQYNNEITSPLFSMLHGTLVALRQIGWHTVATTFAILTEEGDFPLELRFIKDLLAEAFNNPKRLDEELPETWALRKDAMYAETFFQPESVADHYLHMEEINPKDASVKYDIYRALIMLKAREEALYYLDQAIELDKGYAFEYIKLANSAKAKQRFAETLDFLRKAQALLPQNPFVRMEAVNLMLRLGMSKEAEEPLRELREMPWSAVYFPKIQSVLEEMEEQLRNHRSAGQG